MMAADGSARGPVWAALERHQRRREQGVPTLSVLVGAADAAADAWRLWARAAGWRETWRRVEVPAGVDWETAMVVNHAAEEAPLYLNPAGGGSGGFSPVGGSPLAGVVERLCRALDAADANGRNRPLALAVAPEEAAAFLRDEPYSRARTLFAEGMVLLSSKPNPGTGLSAGATPVGGVALTRIPASLAPCLRERLKPQTLASFEAAVAARQAVGSEPGPGGKDDPARSAAERFLFNVLNDLPETAGAFVLNVRLDFCFGPMRAEVDLLAAGWRLAVEIDGFYHFRDPDGYRRDRRKDALLQRQGYLVLRFLAEDVVVRLEEILEEIRVTVAFRRATAGTCLAG